MIVLTNKAYGLDGALEALAPYLGPETAILPLLNGIAHYDAIDARFPDAKRLGGVAVIGLARREPQSNRTPFGVDDGVDLGRQPAPRAPHASGVSDVPSGGLFFEAPFFRPFAAC